MTGEPLASGAGRPAWLAPLETREFRWLWSANLASAFGSMIQAVAASWMIASMGSPPLMVALVQTGTTLPIMLFALLAGALADSISRRGMMLATQSFLLLVSSILTALAWLGFLPPLALLLFTFLIGTGVAFNAPAWQAMVGDIVPRQHLGSAVALNSLAFNLARTAGPALGGMIVLGAGPTVAFGANALSYLAIIACLLMVRVPGTRDGLPRERLHRAVAGGIRYALHAPAIRSVLLRGGAFGIVASITPALLALVVRETLAGGSLLYGLLLGCFGAGAVAGALMAASLRRRLPLERVILLGSLAVALGAGTLGLSSIPAVSGVALILAGAGWVATLSTFNVTVQLSAPRWVAARALALYQMATFGGMAAGSFIWGSLAQATNLKTAFVSAALLGAAGPALRRLAPIANPEELNHDFAGRWREPDGDLRPNDGPILVSIEYRVAEDDVPAFLDLMADRRRSRLRNGALHWRLSQDLADKSAFTEQYESATWADYIRHNRRTTQVESGIAEQLFALHQGGGPPRVRRRIERLRGKA